MVFAAGAGGRSLGWEKGAFCAVCVLYLRVYLHYFFNEKKKKKIKKTQRPAGAVWREWPESSRIQGASREEQAVPIQATPDSL